jgi:hypothetical protein
LKPVPALDQSVTVIADAKAGKTTLEFEKKATRSRKSKP